MKKVYVREDGNSEIGLSHLVRCIALRPMLRDEFDITWFLLEKEYRIITTTKAATNK